jgi:hypothetical protein
MREMTEFDPAEQSFGAQELLERAEFAASQRDWVVADGRFRDAVSVDITPASRIAYGVRLAERERYFDAISIFTPILDGQDLVAIGIVCHNLAAIYREIGDLDLARRFQWRATLQQVDLGTEELLGMASDALESNHPAVAESLIVAACAMTDDETGHIEDADLMATLGLVNATLKSTKQGLRNLFAAYHQHRSVHDFRGMGIDLLNMATLFGGIDRYRAERACLVRALQCFQQASAPVSYEKARLQLACFERKQRVRSFDAQRN